MFQGGMFWFHPPFSCFIPVRFEHSLCTTPPTNTTSWRKERNRRVAEEYSWSGLNQANSKCSKLIKEFVENPVDMEEYEESTECEEDAKSNEGDALKYPQRLGISRFPDFSVSLVARK